MRIATFNANSIRARLEIVLDWLAEQEPDVLAIQETKCQDQDFPVAPFEEAGYNVAFHGMKSYNGVALISKAPARGARTGIGDEAFGHDCRVLTAEFDGVTVVNTYVPNGTKVGSEKWTYKLAWLARFRDYLEATVARNPNTVWLGDVNIAPEPRDVYDSAKVLGGVGHHPDEFAALDRIQELGLVDLFRKFEPGGGHFTFWEFVIPRAVERGIGWRIDHIYAPPALAEKCTDCWIDMKPRLLDRPSDHTFVLADFAL